MNNVSSVDNNSGSRNAAITNVRSVDNSNNDEVRSDECAKELERKNVHEVYDAIAVHFSATRHQMWPKIKEFLMELPAGTLIADVGTGNGRFLGANPNTFSIGSDYSENLMKLCRFHGHEVMVCDNLRLPYRSLSFDAVISIAVIHHLGTAARRLQAVRELVRILRVGGTALIYVWSVEEGGQKKGKNIAVVGKQEAMIEWQMPNRYKHGALKRRRTSLNEQSATYTRYYHMFRNGELEELVARVECARIVRSGFDHQNWFVVVEKQIPAE